MNDSMMPGGTMTGMHGSTMYGWIHHPLFIILALTIVAVLIALIWRSYRK